MAVGPLWRGCPMSYGVSPSGSNIHSQWWGLASGATYLDVRAGLRPGGLLHPGGYHRTGVRSVPVWPLNGGGENLKEVTGVTV